MNLKVCFLTLGCKVNQCEADSLATIFEQKGYQILNKLEPADAYVLSTCAVTNLAERKSRQMIAKIKKIAPNSIIYVCGCASQKQPNQFKNLANVIVGASNKILIFEQVEKQINNNLNSKINPIQVYENLPFPRQNTLRPHLKIQDGCNNFCSYCIIPYLRGQSRSRDFEDCINEATQMAKLGAKEIVITGIDVSDFKNKNKFALGKLIAQLDNLNVRIRLSSLEVGVVTSEFIEQTKNCKNFCPHFHLSLQSGCDSVLKKMNRKYTTQQYYNAVQKLRQSYTNASITTDVIVGFPTETDGDFEQTLSFCKKVGFAKMHIFPYSKRDGTVASKWGTLDGKVVKQRIKNLAKLDKKMALKFAKSSIGQVHEVLIEKSIKGVAQGYTKNYLYVQVNAELKHDDIAQIKIVKVQDEKTPQIFAELLK
ncbi:MAG: tRNA (N(6)-L-threonylcarbamoyladenosine(37)-C(2))-methylthiotransferase MtaB [Clostridia bacterium]